MCVGVVKTPRRSISIRCNARIRDDNPATGAMVEIVVPFGVSKAGFLSGCPVELGVVAASKEGTEDAEFHAGVGADGVYTHGAPERAEEDAVGVDLAGYTSI